MAKALAANFREMANKVMEERINREKIKQTLATRFEQGIDKYITLEADNILVKCDDLDENIVNEFVEYKKNDVEFYNYPDPIKFKPTKFTIKKRDIVGNLISGLKTLAEKAATKGEYEFYYPYYPEEFEFDDGFIIPIYDVCDMIRTFGFKTQIVRGDNPVKISVSF